MKKNQTTEHKVEIEFKYNDGSKCPDGVVVGVENCTTADIILAAIRLWEIAASKGIDTSFFANAFESYLATTEPDDEDCEEDD